MFSSFTPFKTATKLHTSSIQWQQHVTAYKMQKVKNVTVKQHLWQILTCLPVQSAVLDFTMR